MMLRRGEAVRGQCGSRRVVILDGAGDGAQLRITLLTALLDTMKQCRGVFTISIIQVVISFLFHV